MNDEAVISVLGIEDKAELGWFSKPRDKIEYQRNEVSVAELRSRMADFVTALGFVIKDIPDAVAEYDLEQLEVRAEVSAKGTVSLLGTGGEVGASGGITFTFRRRHSVQTGDAS